MPLDYAETPRQPWNAARFFLVAFGGGVTAFAIFCAIDVVEVKIAPPRGQNLYGFVWLVPLATVFLAARTLHSVNAVRRVVVGLLAAGVAGVVAYGLILIPGMLFHIWIGGAMDL